MGGPSDLAGKYRLIAELGQGGMATVYLAVALGTSGFRKLAVVKLIRPQYASDPDLIEMFLDEARLCARLSHPNIVQTYDVGLDDGQHLMAMEYLDGVSFNAAIARLGRDGGPLSFAFRARVLLDVLEGLGYAHELKDYDGRPLQIVHRDVTPHNIFVTYDGQVKLLDFGIAKAATSSVQTATGVIKGKLTYMAPEQAFGDPVDARADLYAVGVMLWEAATGRRRFPPGLSDAAMFTRVASGEMPEPTNCEALGYGAELDQIILRALAPKRDDRFQNAAEMHLALDTALRKGAPASLRELGGTLSKAFNEERLRIRQVIEDQFRKMDSGPPTALATVGGGLPTVHPPTGSGSAGGPSAGRGSPRPAKDTDPNPVDFDISVAMGESSTTKGVSTMTTLTAERGGWRSRTALVGAGFVVALLLGVAVVPRMFGHATVDPAPNAATGAAIGPAVTVGPHAPDNAVAEPPRPVETAHHDEPAVLGTTQRAIPGTNQRHTRPGSRDATSAGEALEAGAPAAVAATPTEVPTAPRPPKRKVILDPDNPFGAGQGGGP